MGYNPTVDHAEGTRVENTSSRARLPARAPPIRCDCQPMASIRVWGKHPIAPRLIVVIIVFQQEICMNAIELLECPTDPFAVAFAPDREGSALNIAEVDQKSVMASKARLYFIPQEPEPPAATPVSIEPIAKRANITVQALQTPCGQRYDGYRHWGLNE